MRYVVLVPLFFFVAYGADQPAEPIPNEEKSSGNSAQDGSQTSALEHELLIQSFAYDLGSNVGKTTPFVNIHFFTSYLSALGETNLEDLAYRLSSQFELRNLDDGTLVDVDRTVLATDEEGFQYRLEFAPKVDLSASQWYELWFEPTEKDLIELFQYAIGVSKSGVYSLRFTPGHAAVVRSVTIASTAASILFSEDLYSSDGKVEIHVTQPDNPAANCGSSVPENHWVEVGSYRLDAQCQGVDVTLPLAIEIQGDLHAEDGTSLSTVDAPLHIEIQPDDWRPCVGAPCVDHIPGR
ncbi:MAG TPA: hypothetical protein PLA59_09710 [Myxococcota bacterium]|nr:hypothetical protein [Myxococcota bacterium]HOS62668.1 hypothetical protein [Myxococcota bacterium]HPL25914.1 hypothetical protein [Myxococcota bacterium]